MYDIKPVRHVRRCRCGARVVVTGTIGPSLICDRCAGSSITHLVFCEGLSYAGDLTGWGAHPGSDLPAARKGHRPRNRRSR